LAEIGIKLLFKSEFKVYRLDMWCTGLLKIEDFVPISNPRCILGSIFVNIKHSSLGSSANNKMVPLPLYKINVIAHEAEIPNRYCLIADVIVNV